MTPSALQRRGNSNIDLERSCLEEANESLQGIGAAQDAVRMQRVVSFYEKLPRGPAPEMKASGLLGRYQARYFGKNPSAARKFESFYKHTHFACI